MNISRLGKMDVLIRVAFLAIMLLGTALIFYDFDGDSLWGDEIIMASLGLESLGDIHENIVSINRNPSWYWYFIHFSTARGSTFLPRVPSAFFALLNITVIYKIGSTLFSKRVGIIAALLLSISWFHIKYAQEVRQYSAIIFFTLASLYFMILALRNNHIQHWTLFIVFAGLNVTVHTYALYPTFVEGIIAVIILIEEYMKRNDKETRRLVFKKVRNLCISVIFIAMIWMPTAWRILRLAQRTGLVSDNNTYVSSAMEEFTSQGIELSWRFILNELARFGSGRGVALVVYGCTFLLGILALVFRKRRTMALNILLWIIVPYTGFVISGVFFQTKYVIFVLPVFLLTVAVGWSTVLSFGYKQISRVFGAAKKMQMLSLGSFITICVFGILSIAPVKAYYSETKQDWRGAAKYIQDNAAAGDIVFQVYPLQAESLPYYYDEGFGSLTVKQIELESIRDIAKVDLPTRIRWVLFFPAYVTRGEIEKLPLRIGEDFDVEFFSNIAIIERVMEIQDLDDFVSVAINLIDIQAELNARAKRFDQYYRAQFRAYSLIEPIEVNIKRYYEWIATDQASPSTLLDLASLLKSALRYDEAIEIYERVIQIDPKNVWSYIGLGRLYADQLQQPELAADTYQRALEVDPELAAIQLAIGDLWFQQQEWDQAIEAYENVVRISPNETLAYRLLAKVYAEMGQIEKAQDTLRSAIEIDSTDDNNYMVLGNIYMDVGNWEDAIQAYQQALIVNPSSAVAYVLIGDCFQALNNVEEALSAFREAIKADSHYVWAYMRLGQYEVDREAFTEAIEWYQKAVLVAPNDVAPQRSLGYANWKAGNFDDAVTDLQKAIIIDPNDSRTYLVLASLYESLDQQNNAVQLYESALDLDEVDVNVYLRLGKILEQNNELEQALKVYKKASEKLPEETSVWIALGNTYRKLWMENRGLPVYDDLAEEAYNIALQKHPNNPEILVGLGDIFSARLRWEAALAFYEQALQLNPGDYTATLGAINIHLVNNQTESIGTLLNEVQLSTALQSAELADFLADANEWEWAIKFYQQALTLDPNFLYAYVKLGQAYDSFGEFEAAILELETAVKLYPDNSWPYLVLANLYKDSGQIEQYVNSLHQALKVDPNITSAVAQLAEVYRDQGECELATVYWNKRAELKPSEWVYKELGNLCLECGDHDCAMNSYLSALEINPEYTAAHFGIAQVYSAENRLAEAAEAYERVIELMPDSDFGDKAQEWLDSHNR